MELIRMASGKKKVLRVIKRLGLTEMYENISSLHGSSEYHLLFDTVDCEFKVLVNQSNVPYKYQDECLREQ